LSRHSDSEPEIAQGDVLPKALGILTTSTYQTETVGIGRQIYLCEALLQVPDRPVLLPYGIHLVHFDFWMMEAGAGWRVRC
jgi:hypothetical protein